MEQTTTQAPRRREAAWAEQRMLIALARARNDSGIVNRGVDRLARDAGLTYGPAQRALQRLIAEGAVERKRYGNGRTQGLGLVLYHPRWRAYFVGPDADSEQWERSAREQPDTEVDRLAAEVDRLQAEIERLQSEAAETKWIGKSPGHKAKWIGPGTKTASASEEQSAVGQQSAAAAALRSSKTAEMVLSRQGQLRPWLSPSTARGDPLPRQSGSLSQAELDALVDQVMAEQATAEAAGFDERAWYDTLEQDAAEREAARQAAFWAGEA